jgi:type VI secretion system protein ImpL
VKNSKTLAVAVPVLIAWATISWFVPVWAGLHSPVSYYLRIGLWFLGAVGFIGYLLLQPSQEGAGPTGNDQIAQAFAEAAKRIQSAGIGQISSLPAVFLLGESGTAKSTIIAQSGLEPELLAGHAYDDNLIAPTRDLNLWYARNTLFIDPGASILDNAAARDSLFRKFLPVRLNAVIGAKSIAPRAVVFTFDCESFLQPGASAALAAKARQFQGILSQLGQTLGSSFPVYVLFTKADKIAYFQDFVKNLNSEEASEVFGAAFALNAPAHQGVYSEQQTRRLNVAFHRLYTVLCDRRPAYLARENDPALLPNIYEFPREFNKLRSLLVQFLVDLCRPSQFGIAPFLRGFYFTGVRPVIVPDIAPVQVAAIEQQPFDPGATRVFQPQASAPPLRHREGGSRKIPQWVFLGHFFPSVVLADHTATAFGRQNVKLNIARRILLATATAFAIFMAGWWSVSFTRNRALVGSAAQAARAIPQTPVAAGQVASVDSLAKLTQMKEILASLNAYAADGEPMSYDALLYAGNDIREPLNRAYYTIFRRLLLAPTQQTLISICTNPQNYDSQGYRYVYDALKAYLITTSHHDKSTPQFLAPVLLEHWQNGQQASAAQRELARENFEFYAAGLSHTNPFPAYTTPDPVAVDNARAYLARFAQEERIYQAMLTGAADNRKPIVFNSDFPGSATVVVNDYRVDPGFLKDSYTAFFKELQDPDRYFAGEQWVLGNQVFAAYDKQKLVQDAAVRYKQDFANTWRNYLKATYIVPYSSVSDASAKLSRISSPQSPLLEVLCVASENTSVSDKDVSAAFQPVQFVTPPGCSTKLVSPSNSAYMQNLIALAGSLQALAASSSPDPSAISAANNAAMQAQNGVSTLALNFATGPADAKAGILQKTTEILRAPIDRVPPLLAASLKNAAAGPVNAAAAATCAAIAPLLAAYPFNPRSTIDATLDQLNDFLRPQTGKLWQLYNAGLKQYLTPIGSGAYSPIPGQPLKVSAAFLRFFNRSALMSDALYRGGSQQPNLTFTMQPLPSPDVQHVALTIDGQTLSTDTKSARPQTFAWPGTAPGVGLSVSFGGPDMQIAQTAGLWALWHFLDTGDRLQSSGSQLEIQWVYRTSAGVTTINGHPAAVRFALTSPYAQLFEPQYFSGLACSPKALQ